MAPLKTTLGRRLLAMCGIIASSIVFGVCTDGTGPGRESGARVAFNPLISERSALALQLSSVDIDNVHLIIRRHDGFVVLDTILVFPVGADGLEIAAEVPVRGQSEPFTVNFQLRSGETVLFEGTQEFIARPGAVSAPTTTIPVSYVGPGAGATELRITPPQSSVRTPGTVQLTVTATDANGQVFDGVPLAWTSGNETLASVSTSGLVTVHDTRGTVTITAQTLGGLTGDARVDITLPPSQIRVVSGGTQTGPVGVPLAQPLIVEVLAADGVPVPDVVVVFNSGTSGATFVPPSATTDATGRASTTVTLGTSGGTQTFAANTGTLTAPSTATAMPGPAFKIAIVSGNAQSALTGTLLPQELAVRVTDQYDNPVGGANVVWTATPAAGSFGGATTITTGADPLGVAKAPFTLGVQPGSVTITAAHASAGSIAFNALALERPPSAIAIASLPSQTGVVGGAAQPLAVVVTDALGRAVPAVAVTWTTTGGAVVPSATSVTNATGTATNTATFSTTAGASTVTASVPGAGSVQFTLTSVPGAPAELAIVTGQGQSAIAGTGVLVAPTVLVLDAFNNPVPNVTVTFTVASGGGGVTGATPLTGADGTASLGSWTLGLITGLQTVQATVGSLLATFQATATGGSPLHLAIIAGDAQNGFTGFPLGAPLIVEVRDTANVPVPGVNVQFTVTSGGATPASIIIVSDAFGRASFIPTLGPPGPQGFSACIVGCGAPTTFTATSNPTGNARTWLGSTSADWSLAANWSPPLVPNALSDVLIPACTPNDPVLSGPVTINHLTVDPGATLYLSTFQLNSSGSVSGSSIVNGTVRMTGLSNNLSGSLPTVVIDAGANISLASATLLTGNLTIQNSSTLNTVTSSLNIAGSLSVLSGSRFLMNDADVGVTVQGDATFSAHDMGNTELTAGTLVLLGNLTASGFPQAFRATGFHLTRFTGVAAQTISMALSSSTQSQFQELDIVNASASGVSFASNVYTAGSVTQSGRAVVSSPQTWTVAGTLTLGATSITTVTGAVSAPSCVVIPGASFSGFACGGGPVTSWLGVTNSSFTTATNWSTGLVPISTTNILIPSGTPNQLTLTAGVSMNNLTVASGATVNTAGFQLQVGGNIVTTGATFTGAGSILSTAIASTLTGNVPAMFMMGNLTLAGTTTVSGDVQIVSGGVLDISASAMTINGDLDVSPVGNLKMNNGAGSLTVTGNALFNGNDMGDTDLTAGLLDLKGNFSAGGAFSQSFRATGTHITRFSGTAAQSISFAIAGVLQSTFNILENTNVSVAGVTLSTTNAFVAGTMSNTGRFTVASPRVLTIAGALTLGATSTTTVTGTLTAGSCSFAPGATFSGFVCGGGLTATWLGTTSADWHTPSNWSTGAVPIATTNVIIPSGTPNSPALNVSGEMNNLTMASGTTLHLATAFNFVNGNLSTPGASYTGIGSIYLSGLGTTITGAMPSMRILGGTPTVIGVSSVLGFVEVSNNGVLDIGSSTFSVNGNFGIAAFGRLKMNNAGGTLNVFGNATFDGSEMGDNDLTAGALQVSGDFVATVNYFQAFRATGTHTTRFIGTGAQTISIGFAGASNSQFALVQNTNTSGAGVTFLTDAYAASTWHQLGKLTLSSPQMLTIGGTLLLDIGSTFTVTGTLHYGSCSNIGGSMTGSSCTGGGQH